MSTGWVYILSNRSMPSKVKVGWTKGRPEVRARELQTTGVPTPFEVETAFLFSNGADLVENRTHLLLSEKRISTAREFFECSPQYAAGKIIEAAMALGQDICKNEPSLLSEEEIIQRIENEKRKAEEAAMQKESQARLKAERQKPCERFHWVQVYYPYIGHCGTDYSRGTEGFISGNYSLLVWCFTQCDCLSCKEDRVIKIHNPTNYHEHVDLGKILNGIGPNLEKKLSTHNPSQLIDFKSLANMCEAPGSNPLKTLHDAYVIQQSANFERFDEMGKMMYMQRYRIFANDFEYLSHEELNMIKCDRRKPMSIYGVDWKGNGQNWICEWHPKGLFQRFWEGTMIETAEFPCKRQAMNHFKAQHKNNEFAAYISKMPCHCDDCRRVEHLKQIERNKYKNLNR